MGEGRGEGFFSSSSSVLVLVLANRGILRHEFHEFSGKDRMTTPLPDVPPLPSDGRGRGEGLPKKSEKEVLQMFRVGVKTACPGDSTFLQRGSPTPTSLASVARALSLCP